MTREQEEHLIQQRNDFHKEFSIKYREGQEEHGGNLWEIPAILLVEEAMKEVLDCWSYLHATRDKLKAMVESSQECCSQRRP